MATINSRVPLSWLRLDPECRLGLRGARFTRVHSLASALAAAALTALFYGVLAVLQPGTVALPDGLESIVDRFYNRGPTPIFIVFVTMWCVVLLLVKGRKVSLQRKALDHCIVPEANDFVLSTATVDDVVQRMYAIVDDPRHFVLFNRIAVALSNLRNLGRVTDVDEILRSRAEHDESVMESSYSLLRGLTWALPVLGFIGTVLGLSEAIGGFGSVLATAGDMSQITDSLKGVTAGLSTAFDTTLLALVAALVIHIWTMFLHKNEEEFCDACTEYCERNIVNRLRLMPFHTDEA